MKNGSTSTDDTAGVFGTVLVGNRSLSFRATLKRLAMNASDATAGMWTGAQQAPEAAREIALGPL